MKSQPGKLLLILIPVLFGIISGFYLGDGLIQYFETLHIHERMEPTEYLMIVSEAYGYSNDYDRSIALLLEAAGEDPEEYLINALFQFENQSLTMKQAESLTSLFNEMDIPNDVTHLIEPVMESAEENDELNPGFIPTDEPEDISEGTTSEPDVEIPTETVLSGSKLSLISNEAVCESMNAVVHVIVNDQFGNGYPGVQFEILSDGFESSLFTGLQPDIGNGFLDFYISETGETILSSTALNSDPIIFEIEDCITESGEEAYLSYRLVFLRQE